VRGWWWRARRCSCLYLIDILTCPCGGKRSLIAAITDHEVIVKILDHLGLPVGQDGAFAFVKRFAAGTYLAYVGHPAQPVPGTHLAVHQVAQRFVLDLPGK